MFTTLVFEGGLLPEYVMDIMPMYEANTLYKHLYKKHKEGWEQTRFNSYVVAQTQSTKKLKMDDIMKFPWENTNETHDTRISNEDVERLKQKAAEYGRKQSIS